MDPADHAVAECPRDSNLIQFSDLGDRPDEVIPVDGVASLEKTCDMNSTTPRATCGGGESGAGAPAVRPHSSEERREQHVEVRPADRESDVSGEQTTQSTSRCGSTWKNVQSPTVAENEGW